MEQVQINKISNGFLVATPPKQNPITQEVTPPSVHFCKDIADAADYMVSLFNDN